MAHPNPFDTEQLTQELQSMLLDDAPAICHALWCEGCNVRDVALSALALAGWDEIEFIVTLERLGIPSE